MYINELIVFIIVASILGIIDIAVRGQQRKALWIVIVLITGPLGYVAYLMDYKSRRK